MADVAQKKLYSCINRELVLAADARDVGHLVQTIERHLPQMNLLNIATSIHRLAKLVEGDDQQRMILRRSPLLETLLGLARVQLVTNCMNGIASPSQVFSNIMWAAAVFNLEDVALFQTIAGLAVTHMESFRPYEFCTLLWACAKISSCSASDTTSWAAPVFEAAVAFIGNHIEDLCFRNLVTIAGAFAGMGRPRSHVFQVLATQMVELIHTAKRQELAKTAWTFGTVNVRHNRLFVLIAKHVIPILHAFDAKELSNLLWGFATNDLYHEELFTKAALHAQRTDLNSQQIANILWSFSRLRPKDHVTHSIMLALLPRCFQMLHRFKPQELASTALSIAKCFGHVNEDLGKLDAPLPFEAFNFFKLSLPFTIAKVYEVSHQSLANFATAFTALRIDGAVVVLTQIGHEVLRRLPKMEAAILLQLLRVYTAGVIPSNNEDVLTMVSGALFFEAAQRVRKFKVDEQSSLSRLCKTVFNIQADGELSIEEMEYYCLLHGHAGASAGKQSRSISLASALFPESPQHSYAGSKVSEVMQKTQNIEENVPATAPAARELDLRVKNTFIDTVRIPDVLSKGYEVLAHPPLEILLKRSGVDFTVFQEEREKYQRMAAVVGVDSVFRETVGKNNKARKRNSSKFDTSSNGSATMYKALQAFRRDYQELRAVPGLDFTTHHDVASLTSAENMYAGFDYMRLRLLPRNMREARKLTSIEALGPPSEFVSRCMDIDAIQAARFDYQQLRAIPVLDCFPQDGSSKLHTKADKAAVAPKVVNQPEIEVNRLLDQRTIVDLKRLSEAYQGYVAALQQCRRNASEDGFTKSLVCEDSRRFKSDGDMLDSLASVFPCTIQFNDLAAFDLQAFRKDYREGRAVPALDFDENHAWPLSLDRDHLPVPTHLPTYRESSDPPALLPKNMKQNRRVIPSFALGPPLDFGSGSKSDQNSIQAVRKAYQVDYLYAIPVLDFLPRRVDPSEWLVSGCSSSEAIR